VSRETLEAFRAAIDTALADGHTNVRVDVGPNRTRLIWSRAGLEIISGDGVDVMLTPEVVARIVGDAMQFAFDHEPTELVDPAVTP